VYTILYALIVKLTLSACVVMIVYAVHVSIWCWCRWYWWGL